LSGSSGRDAEGVGQRVGAQQLVGLGVAAALAVVGLLLGDELDLADVAGVLLEALAHPRDVRGGVALEVDVHEDLAADVVRRARGRLGDRDEDPEHEHRDEDGGHRREARDGVAPDRAHRLLEEEAGAHARKASSKREPGLVVGRRSRS
jgi:hypothetical protein